LIQDLFNSGYEGVITEVGLGMLLTSSLMEVAGASNFILLATSPYNQAFQPDVDRAVSLARAKALATEGWSQAVNRGFPREGKKLFSLAITGCHGGTGQNHAWIHLITVDGKYSFHSTYPKDTSRKNTILSVGLDTRYLLGEILINQRMTHENRFIDVIDWPSMSTEQILDIKSDILYFAPNGQMDRPTDILRHTKKIYRGSFNPPTLAHDSIGGDALFSININNARKDPVCHEDLAHRIRMLNLMGRGVLVTRGPASFCEFHPWLQEYGLGEVTYVMGSDTFNAVCEGPHSNTPEELKSLSGSSILVYVRGDDALVNNESSKVLDWTAIQGKSLTASSTQARVGDHSILNNKVSTYIKENRLYE
jgi:nicotinic acid mononucleotide adenylyltransferase